MASTTTRFNPSDDDGGVASGRHRNEGNASRHPQRRDAIPMPESRYKLGCPRSRVLRSDRNPSVINFLKSYGVGGDFPSWERRENS